MRVRAAALALWLSVAMAIPARGDTTIPLAAFEAQVDASPQIAIARSVEQAERAGADVDRDRRGLSVLGNASVGSYQELVTNTQTYDYTAVNAQIGLRQPILGSAAADRIATLREGATLAARGIDITVARADALRAIRTGYVALWASQRKATLTDAFSANVDEFTHALDLRERAHLLLRSDQLDFSSQYALAQRNAAQFVRDGDRARGTLAVTLGRPVDPFGTIEPAFAACRSEDDAYGSAAARSPALAVLRAQAQSDDQVAGVNPSPLQAGVSVTQSVGVQNPGIAGVAHGTAVGVDFSLPVHARAMRDAAAAAAAAQRQTTTLRLQQAQAQLRVDVDYAWEGYQQTQQGLRFARLRTAASQEAVREATLRYGNVPGDTLETLGKARYAFYTAAVDEVDAESALLGAQVDLAYLAGDGCVVARAPGLLYTAYAWDSSRLVAADTDPQPWRDLGTAGIARVLLSLDAAQIAAAATPDGTAALNAAIATAASAGIEVDLLLGDPQWILPAERAELPAIVQRLAGIRFGGLELDLEPQALAKPAEADRLRLELVRTVAATLAVSPWPVGLTLNYRDLAAPSPLPAALGQELLRDVTLMTYVSDPARAAALVRPILARSPQLSIAVAQSVEPSLDRRESYAAGGRARFDDAMRQLDAALRTAPNYRGIWVQSLRDLQAMPS